MLELTVGSCFIEAPETGPTLILCNWQGAPCVDNTIPWPHVRSAMARLMQSKILSAVVRGLTPFFFRVFSRAILLLAAAHTLQAGSASTNLPAFGFSGPETYPIDNFIGNLRSADL